MVSWVENPTLLTHCVSEARSVHCRNLLCVHVLSQVTATNQINSIPEWFDPKSWSGPSKPNLSFSTQDRQQWETLIQRIQRIGQVHTCVHGHCMYYTYIYVHTYCIYSTYVCTYFQLHYILKKISNSNSNSI